MRLLYNRNKVVSTILSMVMILAIVNTSVMAETTVAKANPQEFYSQSDEALSEAFATEFKLAVRDIREMKENEASWCSIYHQLIMSKIKAMTLDDKTVSNMQQQGIRYDDIKKAELLSAVSGITIEEILAAKGTSQNYKIEIVEDKDSGISYHIMDMRDELWSKAIRDLEIDMERIVIKLGITYEDMQQMVNENLSSYQILYIAYIPLEYNTTYQDIWQSVSEGKSISHIKNLLKLEANTMGGVEGE